MKVYDIKFDECDPKRVGVAYSGAGERGIIHFGVIKAFIESKIIPDQIVGVSSGSIAASVHAYNPEDLDTLKLAINITKKLKPSDFGLSFWSILLKVLIQGKNTQSLGTLDKFGEILKNNLPFKNFSETKTPLAIPAANRLNGQEVWFEEGSVIDAIIASSSLPVAFPPVTIDGELYVDGGVTDALPLFKLAEKGCGTIYAVNLGYAGETRKPPKNLLENLLGSIDIMYYQNNRYEVQLINSMYPKIKVVEIKPKVAFDINPFKLVAEDIDKIIEDSFQKTLPILNS